ncbi:MAG: hypothetical protein JWM89_573 [Acidimicrobiales bacterium]|nr:hypothetical protein [Acidimicrobiales bacterium]
MTSLGGREYVPKLYRVQRARGSMVDILLDGIEAGGGRVVSCSFPDELVAPMFIGAEDSDGHRYGLLTYPFRTTKRRITNRPESEHRFQVKYGDPTRVRNEPNPLGHDPAGVDVTVVLAVDDERGVIVGLDPLVYEELPMGISGYYRDEHADAVAEHGWWVWAKEKSKPRTAQGEAWEGIESMVGFKPDRLLDYARFEALSTSLGLETGLRLKLAEQFASASVDRHALERLFGIDAATILDIVEANFRLGVAVRGSVAEHHLGRLLASDPTVARYEAIDKDGQPDFRIWLHDGRELTIECKNALRSTYRDGDAKVETQKTRDSGAGRKYLFDAFDIVAACMFSVSGRWTFRFKKATALAAWKKDASRIGAIQRIDDTWSFTLQDLLLHPER